jgi:MFS transporter, putative metabolite transport protein
MDRVVHISCAEDVDRIIDTEGIRSARHKSLLLLGLAGIAFEAFYLAVLSSGTAPMTEQLGLSPNQVGLVSVYGYTATLVMAFTCGQLADRLGRVRLMVIAKFVTCVALLAMGAAPSFLVLVLGRCLAGAAFGIDLGSAMAYLAEYLPAKRRHLLNFWHPLWFMSTVVALAVVLGLYHLDLGLSVWRWAMVAAGVVAVIVAFGQLAVLPESPRWLVRKGDLAAVRRSLRLVYQLDARFPEDGRLTDAKPEDETRWKELFAAGLRGRTFFVNTVTGLVSVTYYAIAYYLPVIGLVLFGQGFGQAIVGSIVFNLFGIVGGISSVWIGRRIGARNAALYGFVLVAAMLLVLGLFFQSLPIVLMFAVPALFILFYSAGPGTSGLTMTAMAYPSELRGRGSQLSAVAQSVGGIIGLYAFPTLAAAVGTAATITIFVAAPLLGVLVCAMFRWEPFTAPVAQGAIPDVPAVERI